MNPNQQSPSRPVRALYNRNCGLRTEWLGSSFRGQSEAGHSGRGRRYGTWSHRPSTTADTKPGLQGEASPDLQRTTSTSIESTAPAPEHPVRNRVGSEVLFRDCNPWVLLLTADTKPGLQGEASPDLQRTTSTSTESTAPAPEHPVRNRVGSEVLFRDCNPWVLLLVIPIAG
ncbi:UNVERIFIED_CONTAM: hypothetical protein FKN15_040476 [Acipenser sinensis]